MLRRRAVAGRGRWRCDAINPAGGPSRIGPGRLDARRGPLTAGRPTRPCQWTQAECQGLKRWRVTGPAMGLNVTNGRPPGTMRSKPKNIARGAPGIRQLRGDLLV